MLSPLKPIAIKERNSIAFLRYGELDVIDGAFVLVDKEGVRKHIPVGGIACLMLERAKAAMKRADGVSERIMAWHQGMAKL